MPRQQPKPLFNVPGLLLRVRLIQAPLQNTVLASVPPPWRSPSKRFLRLNLLIPSPRQWNQFLSIRQSERPKGTTRHSQPLRRRPEGQPAEQTTIYIDITDHGISLLRSVLAEHIARDIYRIVESKPEGEIWRYEPGQTVRCRKQKLSFGKALVAFEEIVLQRAN